jgi:protein TIF31
MHLVRVRELIGAAGDRTDTVHGVLSGLSVYESVATPTQAANTEYKFDSPSDPSILLPKGGEAPPKTVKSISLSPWNPPPPHLRQKGHLLYLIVTTNEGEQHQITSHAGGFYVNKSSNSKFDPFPRPAPKGHSAHSLLSLIELVSPSFAVTFAELQEHNNRKDPLASFQITHAIPASPWLVPAPTSPLCAHSPDATRSQETYLVGGVENTDTLRDWNEEFQSAKELPKDTVQDRVFRERLMTKLFADYNDAASRGAVLVARGEVAPLNPTECRDAQIFVYNNVFFSFGADGVGTFTSEGGNDAARVATGKDVAGVALVYQLDIDGLFTPATIVVDYLGKRIVGQSIVPGIFKQRDPGENQIDYGAVDGKDIVAADERFVSVFQKLSRALKVTKHPVWDKEGRRFDLEGSVETKGLMGTDGRRYVLDLYRITPLDIAWLDECAAEKDAAEGSGYPHRMTVLRPELVESLGRRKMREWVDAEKSKSTRASNKESARSTGEQPAAIETPAPAHGDSAQAESKDCAPSAAEVTSDGNQLDALDASEFRFALNPDVFSGQLPQTESEKKSLEQDEQDVREACEYLRNDVMPQLLRELSDSDVSFPMDGRSLSLMLHKRGINLRYLGKIAELSQDSRLRCLRDVCIQDMIARSFKHIASVYLHHLPLPLTSACIAHLLNCLLGSDLNPQPAADIEPSARALYPEVDMAFELVSPESLRANVEREVKRRFRYSLDPEWRTQLRPLQLLREVCLKLGIQLQSKEFHFTGETVEHVAGANGTSNGTANGHANGEGKKKKKKLRDGSPTSTSSVSRPCTFSPDDVANVVPIVKHSCPRSALAEEALEAGRVSIIQGQRKLGQELLLESLSLHEQIYGILHPEVAKVYNTLSMLYYQLEEKEAAVELARKAIIVAERTIGVDSAETLLNYLNLSLFLHQIGESGSALSYAKHALELWKVIYGPDHPDSITTINNGAVMLQYLKEYHESRLWFEESLRVCEAIFGKQSVNSATLLFQLAQALALDHDSKAAVNRMRESYNIFLNELGPADKNTKEAESWLEQLTQSAVSIAKHAKNVQERRFRSGIRFPASSPDSSLGVAPLSAKVASDSRTVALAGSAHIDSRSIDELMKFIEGTDQQQAKASKGRTGRGNPKRRGKVVAS